MADSFDSELDAKIVALDFAALTSLKAKIVDLLEDRRREMLARLEHDAALLGATVVDGNGGKVKRRRNTKHQEQ